MAELGYAADCNSEDIGSNPVVASKSNVTLSDEGHTVALTDAPYGRETKRKINRIKELFGENWREDNPGASIEKLYRLTIKDTREPLFARISSVAKSKLEDMAREKGITLAETIEELVLTEPPPKNTLQKLMERFIP